MKFITVDSDRYGGSYSEADFTAWVGDVPYEVGAGDIDCMNFFELTNPVYGKGITELDAIRDLLSNAIMLAELRFDSIYFYDYIDFSSCGEVEREKRIQIPSKEFEEWVSMQSKDLSILREKQHKLDQLSNIHPFR